MKNLVEVLKGAGVEPMLIQGYSNNSPDFTPVAFAVKQSGADVMGTYMPFSPDLGIFARQLRQLGVNIACVGSPSTLSRVAVRLAGPALTGCYAVSDFAADLLPAQMPRALHSIGLNFLGACRTFLLRFSAHNGTIRGLSSFLSPRGENLAY